jgi:hypothetical protein
LSPFGLTAGPEGREIRERHLKALTEFIAAKRAQGCPTNKTRSMASLTPHVWLLIAGVPDIDIGALAGVINARSVTTMTLDDVDHYSADEKAKIAASYAAHEREARTKGVPTLGSGRIFPVADEMLAIEQREFPNHWPHIGGMDFGWDHPFAAVELVWDRDTDTVYISKTYRIAQTT